MDLKNPRWMYLKAVLLICTGLMSFAAIVLEHPSLKVVVFLLIAIWAFARAYYFAFYVIGHYIDPSYRFAGLFSFARYVLSRKRQ